MTRDSHRPRTWIAVLIASCALGLIETFRGFVMLRSRGTPVGFAYAAMQNMPWWLAWGALVPVVAWLARRFTVVGGRSPVVTGTHLGIHLASALALSALHNLVVGWLYFQFLPEGIGPGSLATMLRNWYVSFLPLQIVTYGLIVVMTHAYDYARKHVEDVRTVAELRRSVTEARLQALRTELNPHFLFNALNGVSGLVRRGDDGAAVSMLARISDLLRMTLDRGLEPEVTLERELALLEHYIDIERVRFADRLTVDVAVPHELLDAAVPVLSLQPLVENAVRHGVALQPGAGWIRIRADRLGDHLRVAISNSDPSRSDGGRSNGVGLANTRERLRQLYGDEATLELSRHEGEVRATMSIPHRRLAATVS